MSLCRLNALPLSGPHPLSHYPHSPAYPCPVLISPLSPARELVVPSSRVVIVEGIYALSDRLRPLLDLRVSITGGVHFDLVKRVMRDIGRSGQAPQEIIHQISETVRRGGRERGAPITGILNAVEESTALESWCEGRVGRLNEKSTESQDAAWCIHHLPWTSPSALQSASVTAKFLLVYPLHVTSFL